MDRRIFLQSAGLAAAWVGVSVVLSGCSSEDDPAVPIANPDDVIGVVSSNHGHSVAITSVQIEAGDAVTLTLTRGNGHIHSVSLTEAQLVEIDSGNQVTVTSSSNSGHAHFATFN